MYKVKIHDGREIGIDLHKINLEEYRRVLSPKQNPKEEDEILARVFGMSLDDYQQLDVADWRLLTFEFLRLSQRPLEDEKNSASESTSTSSTETAPPSS